MGVSGAISKLACSSAESLKASDLLGDILASILEAMPMIHWSTRLEFILLSLALSILGPQWENARLTAQSMSLPQVPASALAPNPTRGILRDPSGQDNYSDHRVLRPSEFLGHSSEN